MMSIKAWHVDLTVTEEPPHTRVEAVLRTDAGVTVRREGVARCNPSDADVPRIGDELAACRALADLAHALLEIATADVEANSAPPPRG